MAVECAYRIPFLTVLGEFEPQNVVGHRVDQACSEDCKFRGGQLQCLGGGHISTYICKLLLNYYDVSILGN